MAMDRCMQIERVYLDKLSPLKVVAGVTPTDICIAHVLASTHNQFRHPEEWAYMHRTKVSKLLLLLRFHPSHEHDMDGYTG